MRTTVELPDDLRAELLRLAALRGEKGFSSVLEEAVRFYLAHREDQTREERVRRLLALQGSISPEEGERMQQYVREVRENWR